MSTLKQEFLCLPLVKENTDEQLQQLKEYINKVAHIYRVCVNYTTDKENGWFKAEAEGDGPALINFLLSMRALLKG